MQQAGPSSPDPTFIQNNNVSSTEKGYATRFQMNKAKKNLTSVFESDVRHNPEKNTLDMVTSTIVNLDASDIEVYEDSGSEYIPDSENSCVDEIDNVSYSSHSSLEIPVSAWQKVFIIDLLTNYWRLEKTEYQRFMKSNN